MLKKAKLKAVRKKKKPRLSPKQIRQRLQFAKKYHYWTVEDWKRVVWSDETKVNRVGCDGYKWVWKRPSAGITEQEVQGTVKFGGGSLMLWGCVTHKGVGYSCRIDGGMDAKLYVEILADDLIKTLEDYGLSKEEIVFQQDNDSKHTSRIAKEWFKNNHVELLEWPPQSPDLNPMEHIWKYLKEELGKYENDPSSIYELWKRVETEWYKIPLQKCVDLIEGMPERIAAVLKAKGGHTKY